MNTFRQIIAAAFTALALAGAAAATTTPVDVNRATQAELETVKGIGPALSDKILAARQSGAFRDWADLVERVAGVGPGSAARLSNAGLTVGGAAYTAAPAADKPARTPRAESSARAAGKESREAERQPKKASTSS
jgi:competence protein ComEA